MIHRYLFASGILRKNNFEERNAVALKGRFVGQTAPIVEKAIQDAMGGTLFLDEAYAIAGGDGFSGDAIRTLLTEVENNKGNLLVILAGYADKMDVFFNADPGLNRRFARRLELPCYSAHELARICEVSAKRKGLKFEDGLLEKLARHIEINLKDLMPEQNGGLSANLTDAAHGKMASREVADQRAGLGKVGASILKAADFELDDHTLALEDATVDVHRIVAVLPTAREQVEAALKAVVAGSIEPMEEEHETAPVFTTVTITEVDEEVDNKKKRKKKTQKEVDEGETSEEESDEDAAVVQEPLTEEEMTSLLADIGNCSMGYAWDPHQGTESCDVCRQSLGGVMSSWRCQGGTHFVCGNCVSKHR